MASRRELALKVEERDPGEFFWILMEACEAQHSDVFHYRVLQGATEAQSTYWNAMVMGMAEMRRALAPEALDDDPPRP